jgi:hypothetical protein
MTAPFPFARRHDPAELAEVREQLAAVLEGLDKLALFQAGAHVAMAIECVKREAGREE